MIFDFHTHVYPAGVNGFWKRPSSASDLINAMDLAGVDRAAVVAIAPDISNEVAAGAASEFPKRLVAIGSVNPTEPDSVSKLDDAVLRLGVRAIKIHPRLQGFGLEQLNALIPIAERCGDLGIPLMICSFQGGKDMFRARILEMCGEIAAAAPKTTVVLAHAGGYQPMETLLLMKAHSNLSTDISFTPLYFKGSSVVTDLEYLVRRGDRRRILFGSDFPETPLNESVEYALGLMTRLDFTSADTDAVLGGNALRLLAPA